MAKHLQQELDYKDFLSPTTLKNLKQQSADSLQKLTGGDTQRAMMRSMSGLRDVMQIERPYRKDLEKLAEDMVRELYHIVDDHDIEIQAELTNNVKFDARDDDNDIEKLDPTNLESLIDDTSLGQAKRRIINSITQGGAIRGSFAFHMFKDALDDMDPRLVEKYGDLLNDSYGIYDDDNTIAMMMAMLQQNQQVNGGSSKATYDENTDKFVIKAKAITFPILVQEIIKGLYEIVSLQGFTADKETNQKIAKRVDKAGNEPEDIRYGKFIYDSINKIINKKGFTDNRMREYFLADLYKLEDTEFLQMIESLVNDTLSTEQENWIEMTLDDIKSDLGKDDTGLEDI